MNPLYFFYYLEKLMNKKSKIYRRRKENSLFRDTKLLVRCQTFLSNDSAVTVCLITRLLLSETSFCAVLTLALRARYVEDLRQRWNEMHTSFQVDISLFLLLFQYKGPKRSEQNSYISFIWYRNIVFDCDGRKKWNFSKWIFDANLRRTKKLSWHCRDRVSSCNIYIYMTKPCLL